MRKLLQACMIGAAILNGGLAMAQDTAGEYELWYRQPAENWLEALPLGNGRLGAMVFGGVEQERIHLNEDTLWAGPPVPQDRPGAWKHIAEARKKLFEGQYAQAHRIMQQEVMGERISPRSYQTLGDLHIRMAGVEDTPASILEVTEWKRSDPTDVGRQVQPDFDDSDWTTLRARNSRFVEGDASVAPNSKAVFRGRFTVTPEQIEAGLGTLELGPIDDNSTIYVNGREVGRTTEWNKSHSFDIANHLRPGENVIAAVVGNVGGPGGMTPSVRITTAGKSVEGYRRSLDLDTAVATTMFQRDGVQYTRKVFASPVDQVVVVRITADQPGAISVDLSLDRPADFEVETIGRDRLAMYGQASHSGRHKGVKYRTHLLARPHGGTLKTADKVLQVRNADSLTLFLAAATDYNVDDPYKPLPKDLVGACEETLQAAAKKPYSRLRADHIAEHQRLFRRAHLTLPKTDASALPTDQRLAAVKAGKPDPALAALYFQFGRYLLIGSSRPGCMPANLQGLWNEHMEAPWNADYHININIQMNYWPAEVTNLSECHGPFFRLTEALQPAGHRTARDVYNCRGFVAHHTTDAWFHTAPFGNVVYGMWPMGGAWCTQHFMEHYRFTGDREFLRDRAWPVLTEASLFFLDWLVEDPRTGKLVSGPSNSPENSFIAPDGSRATLSMGPSMDQEIIWDTFTNFLQAAEILGVEDDTVRKVRGARGRLALPQIGEDGRLMEWAHDFKEVEPGHRHISHLFAVHPGRQFNYYDSPEMIQAARKSIEYRLSHGGGHTGWSRAWIINFWARFHEGDKAEENVTALLAKSTLNNLFDNHPPFQIDGNFGGCAGIAEMLVQSHAGRIELLPALPAAWPDGSVKGLCARGGFVVDMQWKDGRLTHAAVESRLGQPARVRYGGKEVTFDTVASHRYDLNGRLEPTDKPADPVKIIFDTDLETDVDDVGTVALLHHLADIGAADILAMMVSAKNPSSAACLDALNTFFGRPDIPIGNVKGEGVLAQSRYTEKIAAEYPHDLPSGDAAPDAVKLYRRTLAVQPDNSVVIVSVGYLTNLRNLIESRPDDITPLTGRRLVARKVRRWVCMGGTFPEGAEHNLNKDAESSLIAIRNWPGPITFSGWEIGHRILTGAALKDTAPNPVRRAYELYNGLNHRQSWDQTAVLYAVLGLSGQIDDFWTVECNGGIEIAPNGSNRWRPSADAPHCYLKQKKDPQEIATEIEKAMLAPVQRRISK